MKLKELILIQSISQLKMRSLKAKIKLTLKMRNAYVLKIITKICSNKNKKKLKDDKKSLTNRFEELVAKEASKSLTHPSYPWNGHACLLARASWEHRPPAHLSIYTPASLAPSNVKRVTRRPNLMLVGGKGQQALTFLLELS